jgi:type II secretory pathway component PulK
MMISQHARYATHANRREGYVIFAVLIVVVVLSLVAYRFTESMTAEYRASSRTTDDAQVKLAAVSGLHYAAAVLSDRETFYSDLGGNPFDNPEFFDQIPVGSEASRKQAYFSVRAVALTEGGGYEQRFGVIDEGGKLNINSFIALDQTGELLYNALLQIPNMTEEVAAAIVDWVDADDEARAGGAESSDYLSLPNPYKAKNGPLNTLDELLLVKGVTPDMLYGGDRNRNGIFDEGESSTDRGWSDYLTVYGRELNVDMTGVVRTYLNGDDLNVIAQQIGPALGDELTSYILAAKLFTLTATDENGNPTTAPKAGTTPRPTVPASPEQLQSIVQERITATGSAGRRLRSLADLVYSRITLPRAPGTPQDAPDVVAYSPLLDPAKRSTLLPLLLDKVTVKQAVELVPRINVNTAPREVLLSLTGILANNTPVLTEADVDAILNARAGLAPNDPATVSGAWLMTSANLPVATFKRLEKYITGSSMVYRVQSVGFFPNGGPVARMEAVIDTNQGAPRFLYVRDLSDIENPRGFAPPPVAAMNP